VHTQQCLVRRGAYTLVLGVFCMATLLYPAAPGCADSGLTWTPAFMSTTITPGESHQLAVAFTASHDLGYSVVRVASELHPFVQVEPQVIASVSRGKIVHLTVTIAVPVGTPPGRVEGAIRLFSEVQLGVKGGGIKVLGWPLPFAKPFLLTVNMASNPG
jgi:hypothetical protein